MARLPRLPDLLTTANLACGVSSILFASQGQLTTACWLVFAGAFFDVLDGLAARALGGGTPLGAQLDSLADMVTFGVAPAFAVFKAGHYFLAQEGTQPWAFILGCIALVIASAWRLAKFNIDTRQTSGFLGLPTPANGLFWVSVVLAHVALAGSEQGGASWFSFGWFPGAVPIIALVTSSLMLSELPLPSLKFKHFKWKGNEVIFLLIGIGSVLVILYGIRAVPMILLLYLLSPLWGKVFPKTT
ncbi:MAG: CDP-diacylglycerol--serine O-phosphatidyltransferase [Flavobacteriales bacterium]|nr:CDP-diacylglycerol--serine O-phosphatidyltransferase [Flavobacteriales bacterium]